jgi:thiol-disulfide isomerase/thioredoxin
MRAVVIALLAVACGGSSRTPSSTAREVDLPLPELTLPSLAGGTWTSTSARGSILVIDVWASWCKPCSKGFPKLDALATQRPDIAVVAISLDDDLATMRAFIAEHPLGVTIAQDVEQLLTRPPLSIAKLPTVLVVDTAGTVRRRIDEPSEADYDALDAMVTAVGAPASAPAASL